MLTPNSAATNHPLATRMCIIAALSFNITLACMYGTFGVLLEAVETRLGVSRDVSSLGVALVILGIAATSPVVGGLAARISLRTLIIGGALMQAAAYGVLAVSHSIALNLFAYALLIGPGLSLTATVLPATLVTRWYAVHRGRALGLVFIPLGMAIMPVVTAMVLNRFGLATTYLLLAGLCLAVVLPMAFIIDFPPGAANATDASHEAAPQPVLSATGLLKRRDFWVLSLTFASISMISVMLGAFLVPMVKDWGIDATQAASLLSITSFAGMGGTVVFGMIADRLGGAKVLVILCINTAILWGLMLLKPPFPMLVPLVALLGFHAAAAIGVFSVALSEYFGAANFGRALGLGNVVSLPFSVFGVPIAARVFMHTGSFAAALLGMIVFLVLTAMFAVMTKKQNLALDVA